MNINVVLVLSLFASALVSLTALAILVLVLGWQSAIVLGAAFAIFLFVALIRDAFSRFHRNSL